jgi:hypothetical protein
MTQDIEVPRLSEAAARALTDEIRRDLSNLWGKILRAWEGRAWDAMGYTGWQEYVSAEFDTNHLSLPRDERANVVAMLSNAGMSTREIGAATNLSHPTVIEAKKTGGRNLPLEGGRPLPPPKPRPEPREPKPVDDVKRFVHQTAQSISAFAGISGYEECVALHKALAHVGRHG